MQGLPPRSETTEGDVATVTEYVIDASGAVRKVTTKYRLPDPKASTPAQQRVAARRRLAKFGLAEGQEQGYVDRSTTQTAVETITLRRPDADSGNMTQEQLDKFAMVKAGVATEDMAANGGGSSGSSGSGNASGSGMSRVSSLERLANNNGVPAGRYVPPSMRGKGGGGKGGGSRGSEEHSDATVRITNISEAVSEADLRELCGRFGSPVTRLYMARDKQQIEGRPNRGFAFVTFTSRAEAAVAMELLQGYGIDGLVLKIEWAKQNNERTRDYDRSAESVMSKHMTGYGKALAQDTTEKVSYSSSAKHNAI